MEATEPSTERIIPVMRTLVAGTVLAALTACGAEPARVGQEPTPTPTPAPTASARPVMLTCGGRGAFAPSALDRPADAEDGPGGAADALRAWLAQPYNEQSAKGGNWRALVLDDSEALFAQGTPPGITVRFEHRDGAWKWASSSGRCDLHVAPPYGLGAGQWVPAAAVAPGDTRFVANVHERGCSSGQSPEGRIEPPVVEYTATSVVVTFWVRLPEGGTQDCRGAPPAPYEVVLREPLGDRTLLDGGVYPPGRPRSPYE